MRKHERKLLFILIIFLTSCGTPQYEEVLSSIYSENSDEFQQSKDEIVENMEILNNNFKYKLVDDSFILSKKIITESTDLDDTNFSVTLQLLDNDGLINDIRIHPEQYISFNQNEEGFLPTKWSTFRIIYSLDDEIDFESKFTDQANSVVEVKSFENDWIGVAIKSSLD